MESSLLAKETITPERKPLILDGDAEILYQQMIRRQDDKIRHNLFDSRAHYEHIFRESFYDLAEYFFSLNIDKVKTESESRYTMLKALVYQKAKKKIFGYLSLLFSSVAGLFICFGPIGFLLWIFLSYWVWCFFFLYVTSHDVRMRCLSCFEFFWSKFMLRRISKKIDKLQSDAV